MAKVCISCEISLRLMLLDLTDDKLTLVQVMAWCRQATSHYPSQCWPRSMSPYATTGPQWVNSRALGYVGVILKWMSWINMINMLFMSPSCETALRWMPQNTSHDESTSVQVMAWCHQATSHYFSQCWPRFLLPYDITWPPWVGLN